jgi:hypothetical protein
MVNIFSAIFTVDAESKLRYLIYCYLFFHALILYTFHPFPSFTSLFYSLSPYGSLVQNVETYQEYFYK